MIYLSIKALHISAVMMWVSGMLALAWAPASSYRQLCGEYAAGCMRNRPVCPAST
ncbi:MULTISPECIES: hypothetical protein [Mycetohabitans]|uniref:hypothetical protein n=1 Tax=Mycetohabitans TaxID=2571159 RepID=UPI001F3C1597|nr:hypothetical protein [Mycetohabitans sp. B3]MCF2134325.1 hypothetical protein [Mycetohabitans sp. B3]